MTSAMVDRLMPVEPGTPACAAGGRHKLPEWLSGALAGSAVVLGWVTAVMLSEVVRPNSQWHSMALFVHLASLVAGFGAVLVIDWTGLLWVIGRRTFLDVT